MTQFEYYMNTIAQYYLDEMPRRDAEIIGTAAANLSRSEAIEVLANEILLKDTQFKPILDNALDYIVNDNKTALSIIDDFERYDWTELEDEFSVHITNLIDLAFYELYECVIANLDYIAEIIYMNLLED